MSDDKRCLVCGKGITAFNGSKISEGRFICFDCNHYTGVGIFRKLRNMTDDEIIEAVTSRRGTRFRPGTRPANSMKDKVFAASNLPGTTDKKQEGQENNGLITVKGLIGESMTVDTVQRMVFFQPSPVTKGESSLPVEFRFEDIDSYELTEDKSPVRKKTLCRNMKVRIGLKDEGARDIYIHILNNDKVYTDSDKYVRASKTAKKILSLLDMICRPEEEKKEKEAETSGLLPGGQEEANVSAAGGDSVPDMLREYKKLLDEGVITKEDFEKKKEKLLDL